MRGFGAAAAWAAVVLLSGLADARAADLDVRTPTLKATPAGSTTCTTIADFFSTACTLSAYGVRFYGTIDIGFGYQTNGAPLDKYYGGGLDYFPSKANHGGKWLVSPNALGASNIGLQIKENLGGGWSFVGQVETAFDPATWQVSSGLQSLQENRGLPLAAQTSNGDSAFQGKFYNSIGYAGFSNDTWGTLTFGRQTTLMADAVRSYDPLQGAYAFSLIGYSGTTGGGGDTEDTRGTTAVKYRVAYGNYHAGIFGQFGGYNMGNGAKGAVEGDLGADFNVGSGLLSVDVVGGYTKDALSEGLTGGATFANGAYSVNPNTPQSLSVTISDNTNAMLVAKYTLDKLKLYAGYEWIQFANPSDPVVGAFADTAGYYIPASVVNNTAYTKDRIEQVVWAGARYSITDAIDVGGAYYHYGQNNYATGSNVANCAINSLAAGSCAGSQDVFSALVDWKFAPKWDTYIGTMYTRLNGGLDSGYLAKDNWATTAGLRFRW